MFSGTVISCRLKLCKPEPAIFEHALKTYKLEAAETIVHRRCREERAPLPQLGIRTILFTSAAQCERELRALGVI